MSIDFLDKMPDKHKELKIVCDTVVDDLIKAILLKFNDEIEEDE